MKYDSAVYINGRKIASDAPAYFIADIAANHDGDLLRAKELIWLAKEARADAVKFQHFKASGIVSDYGFKSLGKQIGHQASWGLSVYQIYEKYECNRDWNEELVATAKQAGIDFLTTPYDYEAVNMLDRYLPAYKIGSGDVTWIEFIEMIARKGKPVMLATGACDVTDVERAVEAILSHNRQIVLMQCNTNYTGKADNLRYINLNVLSTYAARYPGILLGLSDHTPGHATVLGAIALGARVIEKHFTDDNNRVGPDHPFSMDPANWREMIECSRQLEAALGDGVKRVERNEQDTVIIQRRCIRLTRDMYKGDMVARGDLECLRPAPLNALEPYRLEQVLGKSLNKAKSAGDVLYATDLQEE